MRFVIFLIYGPASVYFGWCAYLAMTGRLDEVPNYILALALVASSLQMMIEAIEAAFPNLKDLN